MATKIIIGLVTIALVANGVIGFFVYTQKGDINTLVEELAVARQEAAAEAATQTEQLEAARQEITSLIGENANSITDLEEGVEANLDSIDEEAGRITTLDNSLSTLSTRVNGIVPGLAADVVFRQASKAVVEISDGDDTVGAGFLWDYGDDDNDYVLTAYHVIEDLIETKIRVILADGTISRASIVSTSIRSDVALLKLESSTNLAPATMADSDRVAIGDHVLVIGHPFDEDNSLTVGVVSQLNRFEGIGSGQDRRWIANLIQFDAPANPGNSGGPVFNADGEVIGIVIAGISPLFGEGISFAVSSNKLDVVANRIMSVGDFPYPSIGVYVSDITPVAAETAGRENVHGVLVKGLVNPRLPENINIHVGDVIIAIDDFHVNDVADLAHYLGEYAENWDVTITVIRGGKELAIEVRLTAVTYETFVRFWAHPSDIVI